MYFETVKLSAQRLTVASSITSAAERRTEPQVKRLISLVRGRASAPRRRLLVRAPAHRLLAAACRLCRIHDRIQGRLAWIRPRATRGPCRDPRAACVASRIRAADGPEGRAARPRDRRAVIFPGPAAAVPVGEGGNRSL